MAITTDDFNKIWASTSPLTPYEFSESQYKEGWNFIGSTPPSRQMWDFLQKQNDEKMQYLLNHFDNYLPLSGGTVAGDLDVTSAITCNSVTSNRVDVTSAITCNSATSNRVNVRSGSVAPVNTLQRSTAYSVDDIVYTSALNAKYYLLCVTAGTTSATMPSLSGAGSNTEVTDGTVVWRVQTITSQESQEKAQAQIVDDYKSSLIALLPAHYARSVEWSCSKSSINVPSYLTVNIGNQGYVHHGDRTIDITQPASWDDATLADAANRKGKDFYIYACRPADGTSVPHFILSANSTVPNGYTATNSRKIGGFHCLCADVGTIPDNLMSGYSAGDIIPTTLWDLKHRPVSSPEGMFYANGKWFDIYLCSWDGSKLVSKYNAVVADGESIKRFSGIGFAEELAKIGKHLPSYDDFVHFAKGVPELRNIQGSADPNTTGGHVNTDNQRIISSYGAEDVAGVQWQFLSDLFGSDFSANWNHDSVYNNLNLGIDVDRGSCYGGGLRRLRAGGHWGDGSSCGSRAANVSSWAAGGGGSFAARGASEPLAVGL